MKTFALAAASIYCILIGISSIAVCHTEYAEAFLVCARSY
jgi:hypothetical protein